MAYSLMVGTGEWYIPAFVLALGMGEVASGLIATLPLMAGGFLQLVSMQGVRATGSHRRWAALSAFVQALSLVPLAVGAYQGRLSSTAVFALATLYWASGMAIGPVWNVWVEKLVPSGIRTRYFARRTSAVQLGLLAGIILGGVLLERAPTSAHPLLGFALAFTIAASSRIVSAGLLRRQTETDLPNRGWQGRRARTVITASFRSGRSLLLYMLTLTATVSIASPFFTAYMLRHLELPYAWYTTLVGCSLAAKVIALPLIGRVANRLGLTSLLRIAWLGIAAVPALWLVSESIAYLVGLQIVAGAAWAIHEYVTFLLMFETIPSEERGRLLALYNLGNAIAAGGGSLLGGMMFDVLGGGHAGYRTIFTVSSLARAACLALVVRIHGARSSLQPIGFRFDGIRPATGALIRPILVTLRSYRAGRIHHTSRTRKGTDSEHPQ